LIFWFGLAAVAASEWLGSRSRQGKQAGNVSFIVAAAVIATYEWALVRFDWLPFLYYPFVWLRPYVGSIIPYR
jgi:hypothetical protein